MNRTTAILLVAGVLALSAALLTGIPATDTTAGPRPGPGPDRVDDGKLGISAQLSHRAVRRGGAGTVFLDIDLRALDNASKDKKGPPINMALVVDRSGSMAGPKLENARAAARRLVDGLREGDRLAIVTYGSDVTVLVPSTVINETTRASLRRAIDHIEDRGGTYLSGGFERGRDLVLANEISGMVSRMILISDGQANEGITSPFQLASLARSARDRGVHVTTMGVGLDFNEDVMTAMAEHGGGHYYFIEDATSMAAIFSRELSTLTAAVASRAQVTITLAQGVQLEELYGYAFKQTGDKVVVELPDVYAGQRRKIMARLSVPAGTAGQRDVASVQLAYVDAGSGRAAAVTTTARVTVTDDEREVRAGRVDEVLARAEEATISRSLKDAMDDYASGDVRSATVKLEAQIAETARKNADLGDDRLNGILGRLKQQLSEAKTAAPSSTRGRSLVKGAKYDAYKMGK